MTPIPLNLATEARFHRWRIRLVIAALALLGLFFTAGGLLRAARLAGQVAAYEADLARLAAERADRERVRRAEKMSVSEEELEKTRRRAHWINRQIARDLYPWVRLLDALEANLPGTLYLTRIVSEDGGRGLRMEGFAASMEQVSGYLQKKESVALFERIVLENVEVEPMETESAEGGWPPVGFEIDSRLQPRQLFPPETYGSIWRTLLPETEERPRSGTETAANDG
jgi:Tfp pilus assembly protein PilN